MYGWGINYNLASSKSPNNLINPTGEKARRPVIKTLAAWKL